MKNVMLLATSSSMTGLAVDQSWCGEALNGHTAMHVLARGALTSIRYRPTVRPYSGVMGPGFLLMQDNARPHVAEVCQQFLHDEGIHIRDRPARSPDLNPTEHI